MLVSSLDFLSVRHVLDVKLKNLATRKSQQMLGWAWGGGGSLLSLVKEPESEQKRKLDNFETMTTSF